MKTKKTKEDNTISDTGSRLADAITKVFQRVLDKEELGLDVMGLWVCHHETFDPSLAGFIQFQVDGACRYISASTLKKLQEAVDGDRISVGWDFDQYDRVGVLICIYNINADKLQKRLLLAPKKSKK
jgi:hypothetical protein